MTERIQKLLATAGIASRRAIEEMIAEGRITVNGRPAEIGQRIDHDDKVRVDGRMLSLARKAQPVRVLLFRKKTGELVTRDDPDGRRTVFRKLPELESGRWIAVGRLDINTSGLLLMTTDGELARRLTHPSFEITRVYAVRVLGEVTDDIRKRLLSGVELDDGQARCEAIRSADPPDAEDAEGAANRWYEVKMREGRNRIVRRLFESQNLQVSRLIRIAYGPVELGRGIKAGGYREATPEELQALLRAVQLEAPAPEKPQRAARPRPRSLMARTYRPDGERAGAKKTRRTGTDRAKADREKTDRVKTDRPRTDRPKTDRPRTDRPKTDRPKNDRPKSDRPNTDRPRKPAPGGPRKPRTPGR